MVMKGWGFKEYVPAFSTPALVILLSYLRHVEGNPSQAGHEQAQQDAQPGIGAGQGGDLSRRDCGRCCHQGGHGRGGGGDLGDGGVLWVMRE